MEPKEVLHQTSMKTWFNRRHKTRTKEQYLKSQREIYDNDVLLRTFVLIDRDGSKTLDLNELYCMFRKNNYPVNKGLLRKFFESTDKDHNRYLDLEEFKQIATDEQSSESFRMMMRQMRQYGPDNYYSTDFVKLLRYFCYCQNRGDLAMQLMNHRIPHQKRSSVASDLIKLTERFIDLEPHTTRTNLKPTKQPQHRYLIPPFKSPVSKYSTNTHLSLNESQNSFKFNFQSPASKTARTLKPLETSILNKRK